MIGDSLSHHVGKEFSTAEQINQDGADNSCTAQRSGGWWFGGCGRSNLNGAYADCKREMKGSSVMWWDWECKFQLNFTELKIRPFSDAPPRLGGIFAYRTLSRRSVPNNYMITITHLRQVDYLHSSCRWDTV